LFGTLWCNLVAFAIVTRESRHLPLISQEIAYALCAATASGYNNKKHGAKHA